MKEAIQHLLTGQIRDWDTARTNYEALRSVRTRSFTVGGSPYQVQFNPARIVSSAAKVDTQSIRARKCFLCQANLPAIQRGIGFGGHYTILVNPFPIFPKHLTIPDTAHTPQRIARRFGDMLALAEALEEYVIFYNGPGCGASAPDHVHFQGGNKGFLPFEKSWQASKTDPIVSYRNATLWQTNDTLRHPLLIEATHSEDATELFRIVYEALEIPAGEEEPLMNLLAWKEEDKWIAALFPRARHRPRCYFAEGDEKLLVSPASVDMGGVFITPLEKDFEKITPEQIATILSEVCLGEEAFRALKQRIKENV